MRLEEKKTDARCGVPVVALPENIWEFAESLRSEALPVVKRFFRSSDLAVSQKSDVSPVTLADQQIERRWREMIENTYPEHGIIGEEEDSVGVDRDFVWVLDPIDGTRAFVGGFPMFTNLFALLFQGQPVFSGINVPVTRECWMGSLVDGRKATFNGQPLGQKPSRTLAQSVLAATAPDMFSTAQFTQFSTLKAACMDLRYGADAYAYGLVALGSVGVVAEASMKPWDYMALIPVVEGAGGKVTDWSGERLTLDSDGTVLAAATPDLHREALAALREG
ncbi:MAG: histidinol phosphate phosphatase [Alphaproteobacteria bacterium TMED89]|nr:histidinol phosphate phosphatase [Rhodospirillaceae bacterium]RPH18841.1 MAG: histidinol phosphate phosphatase [Alphaproteobacteria bacterium TMED89]